MNIGAQVIDSDTRLAILEQAQKHQEQQAAKFDLAIGQLMASVQQIQITLAAQVKCVSPNACVELSKGVSQLHDRLAAAEEKARMVPLLTERLSATEVKLATVTEEFSKQVAQARGAAWTVGTIWPIAIFFWQAYLHFSK